MTRARDVANVLTAASSLATDTETASAISTHASLADPHTNYALKSGTTFSGTVLINTTNSGYPKLQVNNNTDPLNLSWDGATAAFRDQRTMTTGVGGSIIFEGNYLTAGGMAAYGGIRASKSNSTSGNAQGNLDLWTRSGDIRFYRSEQTIGTDNAHPAFRIMSSGHFYLKGPNPTTELTISAYNDEQKQQKIVADNEIMRFYSLSPNGPGFQWLAGNTTSGVAGATVRMAIDNNGNVGVGYSAPSTKLEIRSSNAVVDSFGIMTVGSNNFGQDFGGSISFSGITSSDNNQSNFVPYATISGRKENATSGNYAGYMSFATRIHTGALTERMRIQSSGGISVQSGNIMYFQNPINTGSGSIYCAGGGSLTLAAYGQPGIVLNEDNSIFFKTNSNTDRMRIDTNGYLLIGYTSSNGAYRLQVNSQIFATSSSIATSDGRYKENVFPISSGLDIIDSLNPVSFDWKVHPVHNFVPGKTVGFIAQEVQEALKDYEWVDNIIKTNMTEAVLDEEGNEVTPAEEFLGIAESNIIPLLVAAVKELRAEVNTLKAQLSN